MRNIFTALFLFCFASLAFATPSQKKVDINASTLKWTGKKLAGQHNGTLKLSDGYVELKKGRLIGGTFNIKMTTIVDEDLTNADYNKKLVTHLSSEDFFSIEKYPISTFKITKVSPIKGAKVGSNNYDLSGELTIKGITNPISFPAKVTNNKDGFTADANITVDRTKWGIKFRSLSFFKDIGDKVIEDNFYIDLHLQAKQWQYFEYRLTCWPLLSYGFQGARDIICLQA